MVPCEKSETVSFAFSIMKKVVSCSASELDFQ